MRLIPLIALLLIPIPARAEPVLYTTLVEHDGILDVDGMQFWIRDVIPSTPQFLYEAPPILLFVSTLDGVSRYTYYDDLWLPGADAPSAWVYRDIVPVTGVPEPSTLLLFGSALALLQVVRLRRKNRSVFPEPQ